MPLHGPEPVSLKQLLPHNTRIPTQQGQVVPKTLNPINLITPKLSPYRILLQTLHQILTVILIPPSSEEDEWGGHSPNHCVIGLISDCPTVTVHVGKRFKALIDSGAALSLVCTSVYSMIKDCYKTKIVPAAVNLKTADGSAMSSIDKASMHLLIANFKLPDTNILF